MKKLTMILVLVVLFITACGASETSHTLEGTYNDFVEIASPSEVVTNSELAASIDLISWREVDCDEVEASTPSPPIVINTEATFFYMTFEEAVMEFATDVVVVQYVASRPFGESLTEFEFIVLDRILGYAADRIFVYSDNHVSADVFGTEQSVVYAPGNLTFNHGATYMLPLIRVSRAHTNIQDDGFTFIRNIVIDLGNPARSRMYNENLFQHSASLDFGEMSRARIAIDHFLVEYIENLTRYNPPSRDFIRTDVFEDIVSKSPYVFVVEVGEPLRLSHEQANTDLMATDLYYATVVQVLKGDVVAGKEIVMIFLADTVSSGEQHIIAVEPIREGSSWFQFTSRNGLFETGQIREVVAIVSQQ